MSNKLEIKRTTRYYHFYLFLVYFYLYTLHYFPTVLPLGLGVIQINYKNNIVSDWQAESIKQYNTKTIIYLFREQLLRLTLITYKRIIFVFLRSIFSTQWLLHDWLISFVLFFISPRCPLLHFVISSYDGILLLRSSSIILLSPRFRDTWKYLLEYDYSEFKSP